MKIKNPKHRIDLFAEKDWEARQQKNYLKISFVFHDFESKAQVFCTR
jgi:hypothetical protein